MMRGKEKEASEARTECAVSIHFKEGTRIISKEHSPPMLCSTAFLKTKL